MMRPVFRLKEGVSLVLASGSPRRREFVAGWGVPFTQRTADSEPRPEEEEGPLAYVVRSAEAKLAASRLGSCELVIAADTVVVHGGKIIGKPRSDSEALAMLQELCGSEHHVATGVALAFPDGTHKAFADSCAVRSARISASISSSMSPSMKASSLYSVRPMRWSVTRFCGKL